MLPGAMGGPICWAMLRGKPCWPGGPPGPPAAEKEAGACPCGWLPSELSWFIRSIFICWKTSRSRR